MNEKIQRPIQSEDKKDEGEMADNRREVGDGEVTEKYPIRDDSAPEELATGEKIPKGLPPELDYLPKNQFLDPLFIHSLR